jgi:hypothetical protein
MNRAPGYVSTIDKFISCTKKASAKYKCRSRTNHVDKKITEHMHINKVISKENADRENIFSM